LGSGAILYFVGGALGTDIFPRIDTNSLQMRVRAPSGTRVERTEEITQQVLAAVDEIVGPENVETSIASLAHSRRVGLST
jgi:multidrug efflux pump subunit AcrB